MIDYGLPFMNGLEVAENIRQKLNFSSDKLPIILLHTSTDNTELMKKSLLVDINFHIEKPISCKDIIDVFDKIVEHKIEIVNNEEFSRGNFLTHWIINSHVL